MKTRKMVLAALLIAMHVVLGYFSLNFQVIKITVAAFPVIIAGLLFGPLFGFEVGFIASFISQMLGYGLMATTILWIIPVALRGFMVGAYAKHKEFKLSTRELAGVIIITSLIVTGLNTVCIYYDSIINGYYSFAYVFGAVPVRILDDVLTTILYVAVTPAILKQLSTLQLCRDLRASVLSGRKQRL